MCPLSKRSEDSERRDQRLGKAMQKGLKKHQSNAETLQEICIDSETESTPENH